MILVLGANGAWANRGGSGCYKQRFGKIGRDQNRGQVELTAAGMVNSNTSFDHGPRPMRLTAHTRIFPMLKE